jgi:hypothetical protein
VVYVIFISFMNPGTHGPTKDSSKSAERERAREREQEREREGEEGRGVVCESRSQDLKKKVEWCAGRRSRPEVRRPRLQLKDTRFSLEAVYTKYTSYARLWGEKTICQNGKNGVPKAPFFFAKKHRHTHLRRIARTGRRGTPGREPCRRRTRRRGGASGRPSCKVAWVGCETKRDLVRCRASNSDERSWDVVAKVTTRREHNVIERGKRAMTMAAWSVLRTLWSTYCTVSNMA